MFLDAIGSGGRFVGIDADPDNLRLAEDRLGPWKNVTLVHGNFRDCLRLDLPPADIVFADLGLSSPHIDDPERGFSFRFDGPLDLRFDRTTGKSAAAMIADADRENLVSILRAYGELPHAPRLAEAMKVRPLSATQELRGIVEEVYGWRAKRFLPQVFQALRIWANDELGALEALLRDGPLLLKPAGRFAVISYHSLEDRLTKRAFRALTTPERDPVTGAVRCEAPYRMLARKPLRPALSEVAENPRARSALLRAIVRS